MSTESLNCPNCGAPLRNSAGASTVICDHCGSLVAIHAPAAPASPDQPVERPAYGTDSPDPIFQYGAKPASQPERSGLTSLTLGPEDARHIVQLLRDHQQLEAIQFYHSKVGGSLGEAKAAVEAIESGLRDASAPLPPASATARSFDISQLHDLLAAGNKIGAIKAYRDATGAGLREAAAAVDGMERQLYPGRARPTPVGTNTSSAKSAARGCAAIIGAILIFSICIFGGCGAFIQTQAIYRCSMREIKAVLVNRGIFQPPVDGGYVVVSPGFESSNSLNGWNMNAEFFAPVWGADGWGIVYSHIAAESDGWNSVSARLYTSKGNRVLFPARTIECGE
jgi:ribosomal protein L7/L12